MKIKRGAVLLLIALMLVTGILNFTGGFSAAKSTGGQSNQSAKVKEALSIKLHSGFERQIKINRFIEISAEISDSSKDLSGAIQIVVSRSRDNGNVMYEKKFDLAAGETKTIEFHVPMSYEGFSEYYCTVVDDKGKKLTEKTQNLRTLYSGLMIGVLSDDMSPLNYLSSESSYIYSLNEDNFPENAKGLDTLDLIVVNNFSTEQLNDKQYESLKQWVDKGGSLIIGTGESGGRVLARFRDDFINGTVGSTVTEDTSFGISKELLSRIKNNDSLLRMAEFQKDLSSQYRENVAIEETSGEETRKLKESEVSQDGQIIKISKEILDITLDDAVLVLSEKERPILQKVQKGLGNVLVFSADLSLEPAQKEAMGNTLLHIIYDNMSTAKRDQLDGELNSSYYNYRLFDSLRDLNVKPIPKVWKYAVILFVYVLIAGPILYLILKKKDKRNLTWIIVPVLSVLFSGTVYLIGSESRIERPFIGYLNTAIVNGSMVTENTYFSVTAPYNRKYSFEIDGANDIVPLSSSMGYFYSNMKSDDEYKQYNTAIRSKADSTIVELNGYQSFKSNYFSTSSQFKLNGQVDADLNRNSDLLTGSITNNLGIDLENVFLIYNTNLIYIDGLAAGETVSVEDKKQIMYTVNEFYDSYQVNSIFENSEGNYNRLYALQYVSSIMNFRGRQGSTLIAFSQNPFGEDVLEDVKYDKNGMNVIVYPIEINNKVDGKEYIPDLFDYMKIEEGMLYANDFAEMSSDTLIANYQFSADDKLLEIQYLGKNNTEFEPNGWYGFLGKVYFYNYRTDEYDLIFTSKTENVCSDLTDYLYNNCLRIKYEADRSDTQMNGITLPILSAVKEAD